MQEGAVPGMNPGAAPFFAYGDSSIPDFPPAGGTSLNGREPTRTGRGPSPDSAILDP